MKKLVIKKMQVKMY
jgi:hypothetical protein